MVQLNTSMGRRSFTRPWPDEIRKRCRVVLLHRKEMELSPEDTENELRSLTLVVNSFGVKRKMLLRVRLCYIECTNKPELQSIDEVEFTSAGETC